MKKVIFTLAAFAVSVTMLMAQDTCMPYNQTATEITAHSAVLSWDSLTGSVWVRYYPTGTTEYHYKCAHQNNTVLIQYLNSETDYTWDLNTKCNGQWTGFNWPQTFVTLADTVSCEPTDQQATNITQHSADLSWEGLTGPTWVRYYRTGTTYPHYRYKFADSLQAVSLSNLRDNSEYTWELNTMCNGMWTGYNWAQTFVTLEDTTGCEPVNQIAENITAHTADLNWEGLSGPTWVRYYPTGTTDYRYRYAHTSNAVSLSWLDDQTEYTWELNTRCEGEWTGFGWPQTFTTLEDTVVCEPTNQTAENITAHTADLSWEGLSGPTWVRYYPTGTTNYRYRYAYQGSTVSLHWLMEDTEYTWELNTQCNGMWTGFDWPQTFTTLEDTVVCEPTNQTAENITAHTADLSWEGVTGVAVVRYYETNAQHQHYMHMFADTNNSVTLINLKAETEYTWELNVMCNGMWTGFGWAQTFVTLEDTASTNCEPYNQMASNITAHSADVSWEGLEGPTIVRYKKASCMHFHMIFAGTNSMVTLTNLKDSTQYIWKLVTMCNGMWEEVGDEQTFVTLPEGSDNGFKTTEIHEDGATVSDITAYPNPFGGRAVVTFNSTVAEPYDLRVVNLLGSVVLETKNSAHEGMNAVTLDLSEQQSGIYFVILKQGSTLKQLKLIKQ